MRLTDRLATKVEIGLSELPVVSPADRERLDYEIFASVLSTKGGVRTVYVVGLFLSVTAEDQVNPMEQIDPYAPQATVTALVRALWERAAELRDEYVQSVAPGLISPVARRSPGGLYVP